MKNFETLLREDGKLVYKTRGTSMQPMLHENRDLVIIRVPAARLQKYDVAFYKRGENFVLHRVIGVREKDYLIRGDNTYSVETVPDEAVLGVLTEFVRKGKTIGVSDKGYRFYARAWNAVYPFRAALVRLKSAWKRLRK